MVGLAKRLEDAPFHLVAAHNQNTPKNEVLAYIKGKGLAATSPNFTLTSRGRHPKVKGNGYVPYYMVFDQHGDLVREHMCGNYHGGDGLEMIEWVDRLLEKAPAVYLGREPFDTQAKLAEKVAGKKGWPATLSDLQGRLADADPELARMKKGVDRYRDQKLAYAVGLLATQPARTVPRLKALRKELAGTTWAELVDAKLAEVDGSQELEDAIAIAKTFDRAHSSLEKKKACKPCRRKGVKTLQTTCPTCKAENAKAFASAVKKLEAAIQGKESLPISATVRHFIDGLK